MTPTLVYGMKLLIQVHPIEYNWMGLGISTTSSDLVEHEFTVERYWADDTDPMKYKVMCIPNDKSGKFGSEKFYSSDLVSLIADNSIKILN